MASIKGVVRPPDKQTFVPTKKPMTADTAYPDQEKELWPAAEPFRIDLGRIMMKIKQGRTALWEMIARIVVAASKGPAVSTHAV